MKKENDKNKDAFEVNWANKHCQNEGKLENFVSYLLVNCDGEIVERETILMPEK